MGGDRSGYSTTVQYYNCKKTNGLIGASRKDSGRKEEEQYVRTVLYLNQAPPSNQN